MRKLRIGVLFGGRSGEHEVSLMSARSVMAALDKTKYEIVPIGITREGHWLTGSDCMRALAERAGAQETSRDGYSLAPKMARLRIPQQRGMSTREDRQLLPSRLDLVPGAGEGSIPYVDVIFPVLHGPYGEDGTLQGLLELASVPYVGAGVLGSALAMDKASAKAVFWHHGLPCASYVLIYRWELEERPSEVSEKVERGIGYPCFVKPANLGSSVGVTKVHQASELQAALKVAAGYDRRILVEEAIDAREIECSVLGNEHPVASVVGEIRPRREFYDYFAKYQDECTELIIPADVPVETTKEIQQLAVRAFLALDCAGMARADFFLSRDSGRVYVNELNTIPGFTSVSMYPKLWEASGLPYPKLLDRLIELALERHQDRSRMSTDYPAAAPSRRDGVLTADES